MSEEEEELFMKEIDSDYLEDEEDELEIVTQESNFLIKGEEKIKL